MKTSKMLSGTSGHHDGNGGASVRVSSDFPTQLRSHLFRFCLLKPKDKIPFEKDWQNSANYHYNDSILLKHITQGGNFGVIGGYGKLRILDADDKDFAEELKQKLNTFTVRTGSGGAHFYIISDYDTNHVLTQGRGEFRAKNYQVVAPGCIHPNGNKYVIEKDLPILELSEEEVKKLIEPYLRTTPTETGQPQIKDTTRSAKEYREVIKLISNGLTQEEVYKEMGAFKKWAEAPQQYRDLTYEKALAYVEGQKSKDSDPIQMTGETEKILKDPNLFRKIINEYKKTIQGEETSTKAIFLSLCSIWNKGSKIPLNTLVSSESSAGKSFVCKNIIKLFPKEFVEYRTKITPEAFTYWKNEDKDWNWDGKICYLEDVSQNILDSSTFKVMCSEGSVACVVIKQKTVDIPIKGKPVMLITTARTNPTTEILNRFQIVSVDESEQQTEDIIFRIAADETTESYDPSITAALRCLKRVQIKIDFGVKIAQYIKDNYNFKSLRLRRDFSRLIDLIKCSAALHQYQRECNDMDEIVATEEDYTIARECINYIQTATFKGLTHRLKKAFGCCKELGTFTAKEIHNKFPFVNQKSWYNFLDELLERKMLRTELRDIEGVKQKVTHYMTNDDVSFELPEFQKLPQKLTKVTMVTNDTKDTKVTKDTNNCNNCNYFSKFPQNKTNIYQAINTFGGSAKHNDLMKFMQVSQKDFDDYLDYGLKCGYIAQNRSGVYSLTNEGEALLN